MNKPTSPRSKMGHMEVVVPPDIMDEPSTTGGGELVANEGGSIKLRCVATGVPEPNVTWKRENNSPIVLRGPSALQQQPHHQYQHQRQHQHQHQHQHMLHHAGGSGHRRVDRVDGEFLELNNVTREDMGNYLCIATNGIPPTISKRYSVLVNCNYLFYYYLNPPSLQRLT